MANRQPEGLIVDECIEWVFELGGQAVKVHGNEFQRKGDPDIRGSVPICVWRGREPHNMFVHFNIEIKVPGEVPSRLQWYRINQWKKQGYASGCATSLQGFQNIIEAYARRGIPKPKEVLWEI